MTVIGAGVIGLTIAHELARDGHRVHVVAEQDASATVSGVAGALWYPYAIDSSPATLAQLTAGLRRFEHLAEQPGSGVQLRGGLLVQRENSPRDWMQVISRRTAAEPGQLPPGVPAGYLLTLPLIDTPHYLRWLAGAAAELGVTFRNGTVSDLGAAIAGCDAAVVAAGLHSGNLLGDDDTAYPVRGQVVRLANPGLRRWYVDDENPDGMTYVFPRSGDIVCGGTAEVGVEDTTWDAGVEEGILARCTALVPELAGLPIVSRSVGLRPARSTVRLEVVAGWDVPVIACYGHGGAGVTASWGSAAAVCDLVAVQTGRARYSSPEASADAPAEPPATT